ARWLVEAAGIEPGQFDAGDAVSRWHRAEIRVLPRGSEACALTSRAWHLHPAGGVDHGTTGRLLRWPGVLLLGDLFHSLDDLAVQVLLDREVGHPGGRRGAVPVALARRNPDHVAARTDLLHRTALDLHAVDDDRSF